MAILSLASHGTKAPYKISSYSLLNFEYCFSSPAERAFEAGSSPEGCVPDSKYKDNSIFVAAFREYLQQGALDKRIDNLLSNSAQGTLSLHTCVIS